MADPKNVKLDAANEKQIKIKTQEILNGVIHMFTVAHIYSQQEEF